MLQEAAEVEVVWSVEADLGDGQLLYLIGDPIALGCWDPHTALLMFPTQHLNLWNLRLKVSCYLPPSSILYHSPPSSLPLLPLPGTLWRSLQLLLLRQTPSLHSPRLETWSSILSSNTPITHNHPCQRYVDHAPHSDPASSFLGLMVRHSTPHPR